jgi:hypothetical protein
MYVFLKQVDSYIFVYSYDWIIGLLRRTILSTATYFLSQIAWLTIMYIKVHYCL